MNKHFKRCEKLKPFTDDIADEEPSLLCLFGDSNTCNAHFSSWTKQWGELLHMELRSQYASQSVLLINSAISGSNTVDGLNRWYSDVARFIPDCAIFAYGSNDTNRLTASEFRDAMNSTLDKFAHMGTEVLIRTPLTVTEYEPKPAHIWRENIKGDVIRQILEDVADERSLAFVDVYGQLEDMEQAGELHIDARMYDAVHSNALGHTLVYRCIAPAFGLKPSFSWERDNEPL